MSLFQVHRFVFLVIYCMSGLPLVWACSVTTSPGLLPLDCLQIEAFPVAVWEVAEVVKFMWYVKKILERVAQVSEVHLSLCLRGGIWERKDIERSEGQSVFHIRTGVPSILWYCDCCALLFPRGKISETLSASVSFENRVLLILTTSVQGFILILYLESLNADSILSHFSDCEWVEAYLGKLCLNSRSWLKTQFPQRL